MCLRQFVFAIAKIRIVRHDDDQPHVYFQQKLMNTSSLLHSYCDLRFMGQSLTHDNQYIQGFNFWVLGVAEIKQNIALRAGEICRVRCLGCFESVRLSGAMTSCCNLLHNLLRERCSCFHACCICSKHVVAHAWPVLIQGPVACLVLLLFVAVCIACVW